MNTFEQEHPELVRRYQHDPLFHRLVDTITAAMIEHRVTPDDIRSALLVADDRANHIRAERDSELRVCWTCGTFGGHEADCPDKPRV